MKGIGFDGTSATTLLIDQSSGKCLTDPKLYNERQNDEAVELAKVNPRHVTSAVLKSARVAQLIYTLYA